MSLKRRFYDEYIISGQAGVEPRGTASHAKLKLAKGHPYLTRVVRRYCPADRDSRIIDLGCGHGPMLAALKQAGYRNIAGVDTSPAQVRLAHEIGLSEVELGDAIDFLEHQPPADVICCFDLLEHMTIEDCHSLVTKIYEKLLFDGLLLIHIPNGEGLFGQRIRYGDLTHETCYTPKSIKQLLRPIGFTSISCYEDRPIPHGVISTLRRLIWDLGTLWPRILLAAETGSYSCVLSQNMLVKASKTK